MDTEEKQMGKYEIRQAKTNHTRIGVAKLISDKTDFNIINQERESLQNFKNSIYKQSL